MLECVPYKSAPPQSYLPLVSHSPIAKLPHSRSAPHTAIDIADIAALL